MVKFLAQGNNGSIWWDSNPRPPHYKSDTQSTVPRHRPLNLETVKFVRYSSLITKKTKKNYSSIITKLNTESDHFKYCDSFIFMSILFHRFPEIELFWLHIHRLIYLETFNLLTFECVVRLTSKLYKNKGIKTDFTVADFTCMALYAGVWMDCVTVRCPACPTV